MSNLTATSRAKAPELLPVNLTPVKRSGRSGMSGKILFVTPEISDFIKVGGLGDVSATLPRALSQHHDVRVLIPAYPQLLNSGYPIRIVGSLPGLAALPSCQVGEIHLDDGLIVYILICPELYDRDGTPYADAHGLDWPDNSIRFARLSLAAADIAAGLAGMVWVPDILHVNDWPTALAPAYMAWRQQKTPSILTIHNLGYQGCCPLESTIELGLPESAKQVDSMEFYGQLSFLKAGLTHATHITTVSETYAQEITTEELGCGLHGLLSIKRDLGILTGITHGIDESWQPESDPHLVSHFSVDHPQGKRANADFVEQYFKLVPGLGPLFAVVSRLVYQKGIDMTLAIADRIVMAGGRLAIIGRGEPPLEEAMTKLAKRHPGRIGVDIGFDETIARRMFAGSDFLLMPSRYEPCGLSQMYAQRFGSLPIARHTGGLADTIEDGITGFLFQEETPQSYFDAVQRALNVFRYPELMGLLRAKAMRAPQSWNESVAPYSQLYQGLISSSSDALATQRQS